MTWIPIALAATGVVAAIGAISGRGGLATAAAGFGWAGILAGAFLLQFGPRMGAPVAPLPVAFAMAGSAGLVVAPIGAESSFVVRITSAVAALAGGGGVGAAVWATRNLAEAPWPRGAVLVASHWSALGAAVSAAAMGAALTLAWLVLQRREAPAQRLRIGRAFARGAAARAVVFLWLAWTLAQLVHWRFLGTPSVGSRSEWFGLGITLLATGGVLVGWSLDSQARYRAALGVLLVAASVLAGVALSFGFGSPLQLTLYA